ncbi:MAG: hypothetical protein AAF399_24010, partial [Bacteroidota bacterium]
RIATAIYWDVLFLVTSDVHPRISYLPLAHQEYVSLKGVKALSMLKKAIKLMEIDAAVDKFSPVTPDHPFYVSFENLRGYFQEQAVMRILNVSQEKGQYVYHFQPNRNNKTLLFLAGMRGSGKTSELAKYSQLLNSPHCFFVINCNIGDLDMDNVQYMDILIFQLEQLLRRADQEKLKFDNSILESMSEWFLERVKEINRSLQAKGSLEVDGGVGSKEAPFSIQGLIGNLLGITVKLRGELTGSYERAEQVRETFRRRFSDFSQKFNTFIEQSNEQIRRQNKGQEILFIVDGLEQTFSAETRRRIIMEESNRIRQIRANTIFTLPIELMKEEPRIRQFSEIITFPFVKICERDGREVPEAMLRFQEFIRRRIDTYLFESEEVMQIAIRHSGGSPRQLLSIIEKANWQADPQIGKITLQNMQEAIQREGNALARYVEPHEFDVLKKVKAELEVNAPIGFNADIQSLLDRGLLMEYNDGTYKRVNPLLEVSQLYQYHVLGNA